MNFGKLLAAGKCFLGGRGEVAYREDKRVYLPKFNTERNPFEPKPAENKPAVAAKTVGATRSAPALSAAVNAKPAPVFAAQEPPRTTNWTKRLNPFRAQEPQKAPLIDAVQTELSLNSVRVLHNDLSDADVEVVPVKSRTAAVVESPRLLPAREPAEFFGERRLETV